VGRTLRTQVALYLDDLQVELLDMLAQKQHRTKQDLLREAVNTLLMEYRQMFEASEVRALLKDLEHDPNVGYLVKERQSRKEPQ
jgi:predicted transcriptional regulator